MGKVPNKLMRVGAAKIGLQRGHSRLYLQGHYLSKAGFKPAAMMTVKIKESTIELVIDDNGNRKVSKKNKSGQEISVIDFVRDDLKEKFGDTVEVRIYQGKIILRAKLSERRKREREQTDGNSYIEIYSGGSLFGEAAKLAGYTDKRAIIEHNESYANVAADNSNSDTVIFNQDIREVSYSDLKNLGRIDLALVGEPCEFVSTARRSGSNFKKGETLIPESHEEVGDLIFPTIRVLEILNCSKIIIECGPAFLKTASYFILVGFLKSRKYNFHSEVMDSADYGSIQSRKRCVIIASQNKIQLPKKSTSSKCLSDIFSKDEKLEWFDRNSKPWLYSHWDKQKAKGNNFSSGLIKRGDEQSIGAIKKRYLSGQGDSPVIANHDGSKHRWLTLSEIRRLFELPDSYILNICKTTAGEILGQGVVIGLFAQVIKSISNFEIDHELYQPELF